MSPDAVGVDKRKMGETDGVSDAGVREGGVVRAAAAPVVDTEGKGWGLGSKLAVKEKEKGSKQWNTANLGSRLTVDAACAATAGGLVAPIITIVDKYVPCLRTNCTPSDDS